MPKHPDFEKIYSQFTKRYGKERGEKFYYSWLKKIQLDDTKPYGSQKKESFAWAKPHIASWKESEPNFTYWKVEAAFPVSSMNRNVYTEAELKASARTLIGKPLKQNHEVILTSDLAKIVDAEYEDGAVEVIIGIDNTQSAGQGINKAIESGLLENPPDNAIVHVSLEADCKRGVEPHPEGKKCCGLVFTALSLLDKAVLPGIPLTKFYAAESFTGEFEGIIAESLVPKTPMSSFATPTTATSAISFTTDTSSEDYFDKEAEDTAPKPPPEATPKADAQDTTPKSPPEAQVSAKAEVEPMKAGAVTSATPEAPNILSVNTSAEPPKAPEVSKDQNAEVTPQADNPAPLTPGQDLSGQSGKQPQAQAGDKDSFSQGVSPPPASTPVLAPDITPEIPVTTDAILTQTGFWDRFNLYHDKYNVSRQDSFRLVAMDMIKHIEKGKKKA